MQSDTFFVEKNRRIINSIDRMPNNTLLGNAYNASIYLSNREELFIFGYILQALEEKTDERYRGDIDNLMSAIHLLLLSGYHTHNLPMYYNRDRDAITEHETLHKYCNESLAELIIIILSRNGIKRLMKCNVPNSSNLLKLVRLFVEYGNGQRKSLCEDISVYIGSTDENKQQTRNRLLNNTVKRDMYKIFRICFVAFETIRSNRYPDGELLEDIEVLSKNFSELYVYTYTDILPSCNTIMECSQREELFVASKNRVMDKLLKRNYFNRSFGNILQFIERAFLCKIRDNMRLKTIKL